MPGTILYTTCPACEKEDFFEIFSVQDYTVSNEKFMLAQCKNCTLRITQQVPDQQAIGAYYKSENYVSHSDTAKGIINKLYHGVRKITLQSKSALIQKITGMQAGALLDIGAGTGAFLYAMQQRGWQVTGLEPDADARQLAFNKYKLNMLGADQLKDLPPQHFDAITLWHVVEHIHDLNAYFESIFALLKPGGKLFIAVPNYTSYDADYYQQHWAAYDVPRHLYHFSPVAMDLFLQKHQLKIKTQKPMWFDSFYISMLSEKYKTGNSNLLKAFLIGLRSNMSAMFTTSSCSSVIYIAEK